MKDRFNFRVPTFTDKGTFLGFDYIQLGDFILVSLAGYFEEPQQCTGIRDINKKLVYEGDIVRFFNKYTGKQKGEVIFKEESLSFLIKYSLGEEEVTKYSLEVIGNTYEGEVNYEK